MTTGNACCCMSKLFAVVQAVIRGVCSIIDAFHFSISPQILASADSPLPAESAASADHAAEEEEEGDHEATANRAAEAESAHRDIQSALTRRVLPSLRSQLVQDGEVQLRTDLKSGTTIVVFPCDRKEKPQFLLFVVLCYCNWCRMVRYSFIPMWLQYVCCKSQRPTFLKSKYSCDVCMHQSGIPEHDRPRTTASDILQN